VNYRIGAVTLLASLLLAAPAMADRDFDPRPLGGNFMVEGSIEARFPAWKQLTGHGLPVWVDVSLPSNASALVWDSIVLSVGFEDGGLVTISFSSAGDETYGIREYVDVKKQDLAAEIDDFRALRISRAGRQERRRYRRDNGQAGHGAALARRVLGQEWDPRTVRDMARTSAIQFAAQAALAEGGGRKTVDPFLPQQGR